MTDLVKFLKARLDEIEYAGWHEHDCQMWRPLPAGLHPAVFGTHMSCNCPGPEWMIADVKAKRELINRFVAMNKEVLILASGQDAVMSEYRRAVLPMLAMPFAKHPDYRPEWSTT